MWLFAFISLHFATLSLVSTWNDVSETNAENPYWWCVTTQILQCFWWLVVPQGGNLLQLVRRTTQIWVVTFHQYGTFALFSQTSFLGETSGGITKFCLFYEAKYMLVYKSNERERFEVVHMHSFAFTFAFWIVCVYQPLMRVAWANKSIYNLNRTETTTFWKTRWP